MTRPHPIAQRVVRTAAVRYFRNGRRYGPSRDSDAKAERGLLAVILPPSNLTPLDHVRDWPSRSHPNYRSMVRPRPQLRSTMQPDGPPACPLHVTDMTDLDDPVTMPAEPETAPADDRIRFGSADVVVLGCFLFAAILLYSRLWTDLDHAYLLNSMQDENMFEWFFAVAAQRPDGLLFNSVQNYPVGINMMANTSVLGLGVPLAPVTWLFGPTVTWAVALTGSVAASAGGWYWVISRHITGSRPAAVVGGMVAGFAPPMISH